MQPSQIQADGKQLDSFIADLGPFEFAGDERYTDVLEHLRSARTYLLGGMPEEYAIALQSAHDAARALPDDSMRQRLDDALNRLISESARALAPKPEWHHSHHAAGESGDTTASDLKKFFRGSETALGGVFYPTKYIIATLPSFTAAKEAEQALENAGFGSDEVRAIRGADMIALLLEIRAHTGLWGELMRGVSRALDTEAVIVDADIERAQKGAAFLAVYAPEESEVEHISNVIKPYGPIVMYWYLTRAIRSLI